MFKFLNVCVHEQKQGGTFVSFYDRFIKLCDEKGVKPSRAASDNKINRSNVTNWKNNGYTPRGEVLQRLAEYFEVSVDYLLGNTDVRAVELFPNPGGMKKTPTQKGERDGSEIMFALSRGGEQEITDEMFDEVKKFAAYIAQREQGKK